jgi:transposase
LYLAKQIDMMGEVENGEVVMGKKSLMAKQERAIALALSGKGDGEIATEIGVARSTVSRWRNHNDDFRAALAGQREALRERTADALQALADKAMRVLDAAMESEHENTRLKAAAIVLKGCETRTKMAKEKGVDREAIEREVVIAALTGNHPLK